MKKTTDRNANGAAGIRALPRGRACGAAGVRALPTNQLTNQPTNQLTILTLLTLLTPLALLAAVPLKWTVETSRVQPVVFDVIRGETIALEAAFKSYGTALSTSNMTAKLYWQTNGMDTAWWVTNAVASGSSASVLFTPAMDPGASTVQAFLALATTNQLPTTSQPTTSYRAAITLRFRHGPGATPNAVPLPTPTLDCAAVTFLNPDSAPWTSGGGSGVSTNAVSGIITNHVTSGYLCTVANAQAMTNAAKVAADGKYLPMVNPNVAGKSIEWESGIIVNGDITLRDANRIYVESVGGESTAVPNIGYIEYICYGKDEIDGTSVTNGGAKAYCDATAYPKASGEEWDTYWRGDKVRLSVTNYYGNTSGELPRLRIEEFDHSVTTTVAGVEYVTNVFKTVWDEESRHTNYMATTDAKVAAISNTVVTAAFQQTATQLAGKAPRAWQSVTSAGESAPEDTVWMTAPKAVFAGGTEYTHVTVGQGVIAVLTDQGAPVVTEGEEGKFRIADESGEHYFGFDVSEGYTLGCRTDGISIDGANHLVSLTYDLTASVNPSVLHSTNLTDWATQSVTWEQNPPSGTKVCYIDVGTSPSGFYKAVLEYEGGAKFITNMQADLAGGIAASNEALNVIQNVYPVITSTGVVWRVKN